MLKTYRKKPVCVKAMKWTGTATAIEKFRYDLQHDFVDANGKEVEWEQVIGKPLHIRTLEGIMTCEIGDYIIVGVNGEIYPCKPDIFNKTYEEVKE